MSVFPPRTSTVCASAWMCWTRMGAPAFPAGRLRCSSRPSAVGSSPWLHPTPSLANEERSCRVRGLFLGHRTSDVPDLISGAILEASTQVQGMTAPLERADSFQHGGGGMKSTDGFDPRPVGLWIKRATGGPHVEFGLDHLGIEHVLGPTWAQTFLSTAYSLIWFFCLSIESLIIGALVEKNRMTERSTIYESVLYSPMTPHRTPTPRLAPAPFGHRTSSKSTSSRAEHLHLCQDILRNMQQKLADREALKKPYRSRKDLPLTVSS